MLLRHAKSSWADPLLKDEERPLNGRGLRASPKIAQLLAGSEEDGWKPTVILVSDAVRAVSTLEHMALANPGLQKVDTHVCPELYQSSGSGLELVEALRRLLAEATEGKPNNAESGGKRGGKRSDGPCALAIGHNPGWEEAATWLCGDNVQLKTANAALLESQADTWAEAFAAGVGTWKLETILKARKPKTLRVS